MIRRRPRASDDAGFTLTESLMAMVLLLVVTGSAFSLVNPGTRTSQTQPEAMDMQQRIRVGSDLLFRDLFMAGAGVYLGPQTGALTNFFAPIIPRKMGLLNPDPWNLARADAVTITYIPNTYSQTTIRDPMPLPSSELKVEDMANCPKGEALCGFKNGMTLLIFDDQGHFDFFTVTNVQNDAGHLNHHQQSLSYAYQPGAVVTQAESHTYYYDAANRQLRHYDGYQTDVPVVDNVVGVTFSYYGDPRPPARPKPPAGVANCLYDAAGNNVSGMSALSMQGGSLSELPLAILQDGPWCGDNDNRFDADLLRVKKVRVTLRVQASQAQFRGIGADYAVTGFNTSGLRSLPDYTVAFEVSPRNLNLGR